VPRPRVTTYMTRVFSTPIDTSACVFTRSHASGSTAAAGLQAGAIAHQTGAPRARAPRLRRHQKPRVVLPGASLYPPAPRARLDAMCQASRRFANTAVDSPLSNTVMTKCSSQGVRAAASSRILGGGDLACWRYLRARFLVHPTYTRPVSTQVSRYTEYMALRVWRPQSPLRGRWDTRQRNAELRNFVALPPRAPHPTPTLRPSRRPL